MALGQGVSTLRSSCVFVAAVGHQLLVIPWAVVLSASKTQEESLSVRCLLKSTIVPNSRTLLLKNSGELPPFDSRDVGRLNTVGSFLLSVFIQLYSPRCSPVTETLLTWGRLDPESGPRLLLMAPSTELLFHNSMQACKPVFWVIFCWFQDQGQTCLHCKGWISAIVLIISVDQGLAMGPLSTPDLVHFSGQVFVTHYVFSIFMETMWATQWWSSLLFQIKEDASPSHWQGCFEYTNPVPACSIAPEGIPALVIWSPFLPESTDCLQITL